MITDGLQEPQEPQEPQAQQPQEDQHQAPQQRAKFWQLFWVVSLSQLFLIWLLQMENYFFYVYRAEDSVLKGFLFLLRMPFFQLESFLFAFLLGSLAFLFYRQTILRWFYYALVLLATTVVIADQVFYKTFFDHFRLSMTEDRSQNVGNVIMPLLESAWAEVDVFLYLNIVFIIALIPLLSYLIFTSGPSLRRFCTRKKKILIPLLILYLGANVAVTWLSDNHNLNHHPIFTLARSGIFPYKSYVPKDIKLFKEFTKLRYGKYIESPLEKKRLQQIHRAITSRKKLPNILLVTLESVGGLQILEDGKLSPKRTPYLSKLASHALVFPRIYTTFPGTARAHVPLNTGGRTLTWSSVYEDMVYHYKGPLLAGELAKKGYDTALFSCQLFVFESIGEFYKRIGFNTYFTYSTASKAFQKKNKLNYWGAREEAVWKKALAWIDGRKNKKKPFFLNFVSIATHHPYSVPSGYKGPFPGKTDEEKYYNSLHYVDRSLGEFLSALKKRKLLQDTVIAMTGDHGEAFGVRHRKNFTHKNYIYDENVRTFFLLLDPKKIQGGPIYSRRLGSIGDIMPTILSLVGVDKLDVPGQNLLSPKYTPSLIYFHKSAYPERWGLRDGKWKFIIQNNKTEPEIYDMEKDPREKNNLADQYPRRVDQYYRLCASWILAQTPEYRKYLQGFREVKSQMQARDLTFPGPKIMAIGRFPTKEDQEDFKNFVEMEKVNPQEKIGAWGRWQPYTKTVTLIYRVRSPRGKTYLRQMSMEEGWSITWRSFGLPLPMEEGRWTVELWDSHRKWLSGSFEVNQKFKLFQGKKGR